MDSQITAHTPVTRRSTERGFPEFSDLVLASRHHFYLCVVLGTLVSVLALTTTWAWIPPRYEADALVRVRERMSVIFAGQASRADDLAYFAAQTKCVKSLPVVAKALESAALEPFTGLTPSSQTTQWLLNNLTVQTPSGSEVMRVSFYDPNPDLAQAICNAVTQAYLAEAESRLAQDRARQEQVLGNAAALADEKLDGLWRELNSLAHAVGSASSESLTLKDELQLQAYRDYARQLEAARLRGSQLQAQLTEQEAELDVEASREAAVAQAEIDSHPSVIAAKAQLAELDRKSAAMAKVAATADAPRLIALRAERDQMVAGLEQINLRISDQTRQTRQAAALAQRNRSLGELRNQIELNRNEKTFLQDRLSEMNLAVAGHPHATTVPLDKTRDAVQRQRTLADGLWQKLEELRIEDQSQPRISLIRLADRPTHPDHSKRAKTAGLAALGSWGLVILSIGYVEWSSCRVRQAKDIQSRTLWHVYGATAASSRAAVREAAVALIRRCEESPNATDAVAVMVASCNEAEPRCVVSKMLAAELQSFGRRVLWIDADTNAGDVSDTKMQSLAEVEQTVLAKRSQFDFLIVNGPAMYGNADAVFLASSVDTTLMCVFLHTSQWDQFARCEDWLAEWHLNVAGALLLNPMEESVPRTTARRYPVTSTASQAATDREQSLYGEIEALRQSLQANRTAATRETDAAKS